MMLISWQDIILGIGGIALGVPLLLMVINRSIVPYSSIALFSGILSSFCVAFWSLGLWLGFIGTALQVSLWVALGMQRIWR